VTDPVPVAALSIGPKRARGSARWFRGRRGRSVGGGVLLIGCLLPVLGSAPTEAAVGTEPPLVCPPAQYPLYHDYGVQFSAVLTEPQPIAVKTPGGLILTISSFTATTCGLILFVQGPPGGPPLIQEAIVQPNGVDLDIGNTATLGQAVLPVNVAPDGPAIGTVISNNPPVPVDHGLTLTVHVPVANTTSQLGVTCSSHVDVTLSTFPRGNPLQNRLIHGTADLGVTISIPQNSTRTSSTCPTYLANQIDGLIAMPPTSTPAVAHADFDICVVPVQGMCPLPVPEP
jgi:hypothetical protein